MALVQSGSPVVASRSVTSLHFTIDPLSVEISTTENDTLVVLAVTLDASQSSSRPTSVASVTGGGLTWTLATRRDVFGISYLHEIWTARAATPITNQTITISFNSGSPGYYNPSFVHAVFVNYTGAKASDPVIGATFTQEEPYNDPGLGPIAGAFTPTASGSTLLLTSFAGNGLGSMTPASGTTVVDEWLDGNGLAHVLLSASPTTANVAKGVDTTAPTANWYQRTGVEILAEDTGGGGGGGGSATTSLAGVTATAAAALLAAGVSAVTALQPVTALSSAGEAGSAWAFLQPVTVYSAGGELPSASTLRGVTVTSQAAPVGVSAAAVIGLPVANTSSQAAAVTASGAVPTAATTGLIASTVTGYASAVGANGATTATASLASVSATGFAAAMQGPRRALPVIGPDGAVHATSIKFLSSGSVTFSTSGGKRLLVALVSGMTTSNSYPTTDAKSSTVSGAGLTWTLRKRENRALGFAEVWTAWADSPLSNATVTASLGQNTGALARWQLTVVALQNAQSGIGATASAYDTNTGDVAVPSVSMDLWSRRSTALMAGSFDKVLSANHYANAPDWNGPTVVYSYDDDPPANGASSPYGGWVTKAAPNARGTTVVTSRPNTDSGALEQFNLVALEVLLDTDITELEPVTLAASNAGVKLRSGSSIVTTVTGSAATLGLTAVARTTIPAATAGGSAATVHASGGSRAQTAPQTASAASESLSARGTALRGLPVASGASSGHAGASGIASTAIEGAEGAATPANMSSLAGGTAAATPVTATGTARPVLASEGPVLPATVEVQAAISTATIEPISAFATIHVALEPLEAASAISRIYPQPLVTRGFVTLTATPAVLELRESPAILTLTATTEDTRP